MAIADTKFRVSCFVDPIMFFFFFFSHYGLKSFYVSLKFSLILNSNSISNKKVMFSRRGNILRVKTHKKKKQVEFQNTWKKKKVKVIQIPSI